MEFQPGWVRTDDGQWVYVEDDGSGNWFITGGDQGPVEPRPYNGQWGYPTGGWITDSETGEDNPETTDTPTPYPTGKDQPGGGGTTNKYKETRVGPGGAGGPGGSIGSYTLPGGQTVVTGLPLFNQALRNAFSSLFTNLLNQSVKGQAGGAELPSGFRTGAGATSEFGGVDTLNPFRPNAPFKPFQPKAPPIPLGPNRRFLPGGPSGPAGPGQPWTPKGPTGPPGPEIGSGEFRGRRIGDPIPPPGTKPLGPPSPYDPTPSDPTQLGGGVMLSKLLGDAAFWVNRDIPTKEENLRLMGGLDAPLSTPLMGSPYPNTIQGAFTTLENLISAPHLVSPHLKEADRPLFLQSAYNALPNIYAKAQALRGLSSGAEQYAPLIDRAFGFGGTRDLARIMQILGLGSAIPQGGFASPSFATGGVEEASTFAGPSFGTGGLETALLVMQLASAGKTLFSSLLGGGEQLAQPGIETGSQYSPLVADFESPNSLANFMSLLQIFGPGGLSGAGGTGQSRLTGPSQLSSGIQENTNPPVYTSQMAPDFRHRIEQQFGPGQWFDFDTGSEGFDPGSFGDLPLAQIARQFSLPAFPGQTYAAPTALQRQSTDYASELLRSNPFANTANVGRTLEGLIGGGEYGLSPDLLASGGGQADVARFGGTDRFRLPSDILASGGGQYGLSPDVMGGFGLFGMPSDLTSSSGGPEFSLSPMFRALEDVTNRRLAEQSAGINEQFGAQGLRYGSDIANAQARMRGDVLSQESLMRAQLTRDAFENAQARRLQALGMEQASWENMRNRQLQATGLAQSGFEAAQGRRLQGAGLEQQGLESEQVRRLQLAGMSQAGFEGARAGRLQAAGLGQSGFEAARNRQLQALQLPSLLQGQMLQNILGAYGLGEQERQARERGTQRTMAEFARTQGAFLPLLLQYALTGTEGDTLIVPPVEV